VFPWYAWQDRDRGHDSVRVGAFALEALKQLKASFSGVSESTVVLGDEASIIVRSVHQRFWVPAFSHRSRPPDYGQEALPQSLLVEHWSQ
jgi:hypothetical protein